MKLTTVLAIFAGLDFVAASPEPTSPQPDKPLVFWDPENAYEHLPQIKEQWRERCEEGFRRAGCGVGVIHKGRTVLTKSNGEMTTYMNVEGAPLMDMEKSEKLRIFDDGSSRSGWAAKDREFISELKNKDTHKGPAAVGRDALLYWDPADSYKRPKRRVEWERRCDEALAREGCGYGVMHKGESTLTKANGEKASYLLVEARPSVDMGPNKKLRVFDNGSSEKVTDWSLWDRTAMLKAKQQRRRRRPKDPDDPKRPSGAWLVWDRSGTYDNFPGKKLFWGQKCEEVLSREECLAGIMHKGESVLTKSNGERLSYLNVQGLSAKDLGLTKLMRVFEDGSTEDFTRQGWTKQDQKSISRGQQSSVSDTKKAGTGTQATAERPRVGMKRKEGTSPQAPGGVEHQLYHSTTIAPTQEHPQGSPKRRRVGP